MIFEMGNRGDLMFENDGAILKIQIKIALREKFYFIYTLILPTFMAFINKNQYFQDNESIYMYWSYIIVTTIFNGFLINIIRLREGGFFKTLSYMMKSKHSIILANLLVQCIVIQIEILLFNLIVTFFITPLSIFTLVHGFLVAFLATVICSAMLSILLVLKMKQIYFNWLIGFLFVIGIAALGLHPVGVWHYFLSAFNPFQTIYGIYQIPNVSNSYGFFMLIIASVYLIIGGMIFKHVSIKSQLK